MNGFDFFHEKRTPDRTLDQERTDGATQPSIERPAGAKRPDTAVERKPKVVRYGMKVPFNPHRSIAVGRELGDD